MNHASIASPPVTGPRGLYNRLAARLDALVTHDVLALAARLGMGAVFWLSGRTKVDGWFSVSDGAVTLFAEEYRLPLLPPEIAAHLAAYAEHLFPLLLVLGLGTRGAALALLGMTAVIEIFVYPDAWPTHLVWATCLLYLVGRGAGRLSLDARIGLH
jgi:putative oxidoreductase